MIQVSGNKVINCQMNWIYFGIHEFKSPLIWSSKINEFTVIFFEISRLLLGRFVYLQKNGYAVAMLTKSHDEFKSLLNKK